MKVPPLHLLIAAVKNAFKNAIKNRSKPADPLSLRASVRKWQILAAVLVFGFFGVAFVSAGLVRIDGAAIAPGVVSVESNRKDIQHLEGGIVKEILVHENDTVKKGQVLAYLDDTRARAQLDLLTNQWRSALITRARLIAERDGKADLAIPAQLNAVKNDADVRKMVDEQRKALRASHAYVKNKTDVTRYRIERLKNEIQGYNAKADSDRAQLRLVEEELGPLTKAHERGVVGTSPFMNLKRKEESIRGDISESRAKVEAAKRNIQELQEELTLPAKDRSNEIATQLDDIQGRIGDLREQIAAARDVLDRTLIVAPDDGTIVDLKIHTRGGVINPGQTIMGLIPSNDKLVIEARVEPRDRDIVFGGMKARIRLTAYSARDYRAIEGTVTAISADRITDPATGTSYFKATVVPDRSEAKELKQRTFIPGMIAEVFLVTGSRTILEYLLSPLERYLNHAGREA